MDVSKLKDKDREIAELIGEDNYALLIDRYGGITVLIKTVLKRFLKRF